MAIYGIEYFLDKCDAVDIEQIIEHLMHRGYLPTSLKERGYSSAGELYFEEQLNKLHGKWNQLSKEEEEYIVKLSKRF